MLCSSVETQVGNLWSAHSAMFKFKEWTSPKRRVPFLISNLGGVVGGNLMIRKGQVWTNYVEKKT